MARSQRREWFSEDTCGEGLLPNLAEAMVERRESRLEELVELNVEEATFETHAATDENTSD